ncbi:MAG: DUF4440 domain-containing protein [Vicinamibacterales bacterium]
MPSPDNLKEEIVAREAIFVDFYNGQNANQLADMYTVTAEILPQNLPVTAGSEAIRAMFRSFWDADLVEIALVTREVTGTAEWAYEVGTYVLRSSKGVQEDEGKYLVIWQKVNGKWKLHRDIFNTDRPA